MAELGVDRTVELPPAGTLTGLVKRELKGTVTTPVAVKTPAQLEELA
jgi:[acyl-carrier-protein] S-malonyltransferase